MLTAREDAGVHFLCVCLFLWDSVKHPQMKLNVTWSVRMSREFTVETDASGPGSRFQGADTGTFRMECLEDPWGSPILSFP